LVHVNLSKYTGSLRYEPRLSAQTSLAHANVLKQTGVPTSIIKELMGYDSEKTTKIYLEDFGNKILDDATKGIL